ncbi:hypothetical protein [Streptomyces sp. SID4982]|uniref:hypothetical protein n=1 Tax=Streptomyces sp. SID4982 TaxID=2690291 RepID=UPI00192852C8|nr:hypothetical protein [Streptomyces sp. SID4982]
MTAAACPRTSCTCSFSGTVFFMPPGTLPTDKSTEFCQGFADVLVSLAASERA